ncbi:MAG: DUF4339 domain-containing protein, partial [Actinobacteria bacterium]|nr:DUF4339 domain-containing protein [Actinomycetota bacterium]
MNGGDRLDGWYYKTDGRAVGPVSERQLRESLASGRLTPRQPVWRQGEQCVVFVTAATAVS